MHKNMTFIPIFIKVLVNKSRAYSFKIISMNILPSVSSPHLPGVSCKKIYTTTKFTISPLHFGSQNSKSQPISNLGRTAKSFRLSNLNNRRFSKISMCNARRCLTCHHIPCKSTITSSINGNRYGIKMDKDVECNSSNLIYAIR